MIDTHMHADSRSSEDFEKMFIGGIDTAITCSFYPYTINDNPEILLNHLNRILNFEPKRAGEYGLDLKVALGIHPANALPNNEIIFKHICEQKSQKHRYNRCSKKQHPILLCILFGNVY